MEKNIIRRFIELVQTELLAALAERRVSDPEADSANVEFNVREVLEYLGAKNTTIKVDVQKDYAWLRVRTSNNGFNYPIDFAQRKQATRSEVSEAKEMGNVYFDEAICTAGIYDDGESQKFSMKWDALINGGEVFAFSGPVRKWSEEKQAYDGPVAE